MTLYKFYGCQGSWSKYDVTLDIPKRRVKEILNSTHAEKVERIK